MATTRNSDFTSMLNDYLANELLYEEWVKRDYVFNKVEKDDSWVGASSTSNEGAYIVPFMGATASSVAFGALTADTDISQDKPVRGRVTTQKELWGSMLFYHRDLMEHNKLSEKNFLKLLPDAINRFMDYLKNVAGCSLLNGPHACKATADGAADGTIQVDRPDRLTIGQKLSIDDDNSSATDVYVTAIDMNTRTITLSATRGGGGLDLTGGSGPYTLAQNAILYHPGSQASGFESLKSAFLPASVTGGSSTLYGVTKTAYPYLQAIAASGADITATNILEKIFDHFVKVRQYGKGNPTDVLMSYKNLGSCMKVIEASKGGFNVMPGSQKASQYGWTEIEIGSVTRGGLKLIGIQECDDDCIFFVDWRGIKFASNGLFQKRKSPDGTEYFEQRATTGYTYIVDISLFGELIVHRPSYQGILHSISY